MKIREKIKELRKKKGWTQKQLGMKIGLREVNAQAYISHYETGKYKPTKRKLRKLSEVLGENLITYTPEKQNEEIAREKILDYLKDNYPLSKKEIVFDCNLELDIINKVLDQEEIDLKKHYYTKENLAIDFINQLETIFNKSKEIKQQNYKLAKKLDSETQDYLHALEFFDRKDKSKQDKIKFLSKFKSLRVRRRKVKNQNKLLEHLVDILNNYSSLESDIKKLKSKLNKELSKIKKQRYSPRENEELFDYEDTGKAKMLKELKNKMESHNAK